MNTEQLEQRANEILLDMLERASGAVDFAAGQIPEVVEQLLLWHSVKGLVWFFVGVLIFVGIGILLWRTRLYIKAEKEKRSYGDADIVWMPISIIAMLAAIPGLCFLYGIMGFLKIQLAPKLYLLEYAAGLVK